MAEYIKREDIIKWIDDSLELCGSRYSTEQENMMELFRTVVNDCLPFADVVEVVRCKDCRFFAPDTYGDIWCSAKSPGVSKGMYSPSGDSYCSDAERKQT